jgi:putative ABC transport system permease protein
VVDSNGANTIAFNWQFWQDVRVAARSMLVRPSVPWTVVLTLGLAIAITTAVFGALDAVVLRPMPVREQTRLVVLRGREVTRTDQNMSVPNGILTEFSARSRAIAGVAGVSPTAGASPFPVGDGDRTLQLAVTPVTTNLLTVLGVVPVTGRLLDSVNAQGAPVLVLSHTAWLRDFGGAPDIVGRRLSLFGMSFTVAGVLPDGFEYPASTDVWISAEQLARAWGRAMGPDDGAWTVVARLRAGASAEEARDDFRRILRQYQSPELGDSSARDATIRPFTDEVLGSIRPTLTILFGAVALLLVSACANVAGLMLARGLRRAGEFATRSALGASRRDMLRQLLAESVVLAAGVTVVGAAGGALLLYAALGMAPPHLPRFDHVRFDIPTVLFATVLGLGCATIVGLVPAYLVTSRYDIASVLRSAGSVGRPGRIGWGRQCLTVAQIGLAVAVLAGAALVGDALVRLSRVDLGFESHRLLYVIVERHTTGGAQADFAVEQARYREVMDGLVERLRGQPGIVGATPTFSIPFDVVGGTYGIDNHYNVEGQALHDNLKSPAVGYDAAADNYFDVLGIPLRRGRVFAPEDNAGSPRVAIVSEAMARAAWPGQDPIGKRVRLGNEMGQGPWRTVVGVVGDRRDRRLAAVRPIAYIPIRQAQPGAVLIIRTTGDPRLALPTVTRVLHDFDDGYRIGRAITIGEVLDVALAVPRFLTSGLAVLAAIITIVAAVGISAILSLLVRDRMREIGIRAAFGATGADIAALIVPESARLVVAGLVVGLILTIISGIILRALVTSLTSVSLLPVALAATVVMIVIAAIATAIPTVRAMRVAPAEPLRCA